MEIDEEDYALDLREIYENHFEEVEERQPSELRSQKGRNYY